MRAVTAVGVRDDSIYSIAALIPDCELRAGGWNPRVTELIIVRGIPGGTPTT
jgi:hypothetical protein